MEKDNIEKIDEQIQNFLEEEERHKKDPTRKVNIDTLHEEESSLGDTKKITKIDDIDDEPIEEEKEIEITKKQEKIEEEKKEPEKEEIEEKEEKNKKNKNKKKIIIIIVIIITLLFLLSIILILVLSKKEKTIEVVEDNDTLSKNEQKEIINDYGKAVEGIISVYYEKQNVLLEYDDATKLVNFDYKVTCNEHETYEDGSLYLNKCSINKQKTSYSYGKKQEKKEPIINEGDIFVYVSKDNNKATFKEPTNKDKYDIYSFSIDGSYSELTFLNEYSSPYVFYLDDNYNVHMIDYKTSKPALSPLEYQSILPIKHNDSFDTSYVAIEIYNKWGIYNLNTRERVVQHIYDYIALSLSMGISGPPLFINSLDGEKIAVMSGSKYGVIEYKTGKEIIKPIYNSMFKSGNYLWVVDDNEKGHILDYSNNEYLNDTYDELYGFVDGKYALVNDKGKIKMINIDGKVLYDYGELELGPFNYAMSYNGAVFSFQKKEQSDDFDNCFEITYNPETKKGEAKDIICGGLEKPILYLYPKKETKLTISFEHPEYLETTYPKFRGKWEVDAKPNGDLYDSKNNYYYALYWDEIKVHNVDFTKGYYVEKDDAIEFLEKKLDYIGLNSKEKNEFIMYWLPILEKNQKSLVYFELTEERESYNKLLINPKPDSLLRLVIHIKKVDRKIEIPKQNLTKFQRKGFVAVEWGGTTY